MNTDLHSPSARSDGQLHHGWRERADSARHGAEVLKIEALALGRRTHQRMSDAPVQTALIAALAGVLLTGAAWLVAQRMR